MMQVIYFAIVAVLGYLLGSISFAVIVSKGLRGDDVRNHGSGNAGMTNVLRVYGKKMAAMVCAGDFAKGIIAVYIGRLVFTAVGITLLDGGYVGGVFALIGHLFPLYFGFKGGKGVLTSAGIMLVINPLVFLFLVPATVVLMFITRIVSLGSVLAALLYPIITYLVNTYIYHSPATLDTVASAIMGGVVILMHRENIKRLLNGTESRFGQKKPAEQENRKEWS